MKTENDMKAIFLIINGFAWIVLAIIFTILSGGKAPAATWGSVVIANIYFAAFAIVSCFEDEKKED